MRGTVRQAAAQDGRDWRRLLAVTFALGGWVVGLGISAHLATSAGELVGGDLSAYLRVGDDLVAGNRVYVGEIGEFGVFSYAPPWAVLFGALSWIPDALIELMILILSLASIRFVAGSWLWAGLVFWYPVSAMVLHTGNIEFLIAGSIVLAARGHSGPLAFTGLAKLSPFLAVPRSGWREAALVVAIAIVITLPWLHLWQEWVEYLLRQPTTIGIHIGPPWFVRLPFALLLLLVRRPWASALAVIVAIPSLWMGTLVIVNAVVRLWLDGRVRKSAHADALDGSPS
jgi:hypothetical protein